MAAVERLGYVANGAARALAMRRTMTVGAIVPRFGGSSFPTMIQALETELSAHGYTLLLSAPEHHLSKEPTILRALLERGVDAVALLGEEQLAHVVPMLSASRTPFVMMWAPPLSTGHAAVGFDEQEAAALVVKHLSALGHRRLGFIGGLTADNARALRRFHGFTAEVAKRGMTISETAMIETNYGFEQGYAAMERVIQVLGTSDGPTAVVCGNDYLAAGALSALDRAGVKVPSELSIISFNDNDFAPYLHPPLTTVRLPIREIGEQAGVYLIARMRGLEPPERSPLHVELVVRQSTGKVPTNSSRRRRAARRITR
ncbi:Transcriptional regulator, LacI family [Burkholderiales bacterium 8X]|nr:Transcriptional regulator, LacI family [Burkholderiales bacterium 8X]